MRMLIYGGRDFIPSHRSFAAFHDEVVFWQLVGTPITRIISGGAKGADTYGEDLARFWSIPVDSYPADWATHGRKAGILRNIQMLEEGKPDYAFQFPGGKGTAHMRSLLDKAGIEVREYIDAEYR